MMELRQQLEAWAEQGKRAPVDSHADWHVAKRLLTHGIEALDRIAALQRDLAAAQAERDGLLRIKEAADVLYSEAEEYDLPDGLGMGTSQQYWDDLADALFPDDSGEVIQADLENVQAAVDGAWEAFNEELNKPEFLPCGHHHSMMLKSAETGEPLYCELCDCISRRNDAERDLAAAQQDKGLAKLAMSQKSEQLVHCEEALAAAQAERGAA